MYVAHLKTIFQEIVASGWYISRAKELQNKILEQINRLDWSVNRLARELYYDEYDEDADEFGSAVSISVLSFSFSSKQSFSLLTKMWYAHALGIGFSNANLDTRILMARRYFV